MSKRRKQPVDPSRRNFLQTAGVAAGAVLIPESLWAQGKHATPTNRNSTLTKINPQFMITPDQAWDWASFKAQCGPTRSGSAGWKRYTDFLISEMPKVGAVDLDYVEFSYNHYIVDDWPDRKTHIYNSGIAVEKLVSGGTPVPVVAAHGETSGFTPPEGITAPMLFYDPAHPPTNEQIAGKVLVFQTPPLPDPPYTDEAYNMFWVPSDYLWRSPGKWPPLYKPIPASVDTTMRYRWVWQSHMARFPEFGRKDDFATVGINGHAAGIVVVLDMSPGGSFGNSQMCAYAADGALKGEGGLGEVYVNCPTLILDRVNGAKVLVDAKAGKTATLTLIGRFERVKTKGIIAYLPGKNYGTPLDEQILVNTHTDAQSMIEENGGLGFLAMMSYFNHIPKSARPRTLTFWLDNRHFMPGAEGSWPQGDYYAIHPERLKPIMATMGLEHLGGRATIETGPGGNDYVYSKESPEDGGVITSLIDVYNNNIWLVEAVARAATDNHWPRVEVHAGPGEGPGVNGGFQGWVHSPMNKGRGGLGKGNKYHVPGLGLAGNWPGAWSQKYSQVDTEAGPAGFDKDYFLRQIAGMSQLAGEFMLVDPKVIDLGWGHLKAALINLPDSGFVAKQNAATQRQTLVSQYEAAFRKVEVAAYDDAKSTLRNLAANVSTWVASDKQASVRTLVDGQISKLS